jgi:hypothetical protein
LSVMVCNCLKVTRINRHGAFVGITRTYPTSFSDPIIQAGGDDSWAYLDISKHPALPLAILPLIRCLIRCLVLCLVWCLVLCLILRQFPEIWLFSLQIHLRHRWLVNPS